MHSVFAVVFQSEEEVRWRRGPPVTYYCLTLDPPLDGSGRKTTTLVRDHEYFIPTKFHQNPSRGSGEEVENVKSLPQTDGRTTDDGRCAMTIAHSSLRFRLAKNYLQQVEHMQVINETVPGTQRSKRHLSACHTSRKFSIWTSLVSVKGRVW